jgi:hypothetical protein
LNVLPAERERMNREGLKLAHDLTVGETAVRVRLLVVDRRSNTRATVTIPIP